MPNDELYTPKYIFDALGLIFDLDVCAPIGGPLHVPAVEYFDVESDGLMAKWFGNVWMNPPYSKPDPWITKWLEHGNGFTLVAFSKANWFGRLWDSEAKVVRLPTNTAFITPEGKKQQIYLPTALWAIGDHNVDKLRASGLGLVR